MLLCLQYTLHAQKITIVGCGYVGLTLASIFLNHGHTVTCTDIDHQKISELHNEIVSIYEPQLYQQLFNPATKNNLSFSQDLSDAEIYFICVATPTDSNGQCDCSCLYQAFNAIIKHRISNINSTIICIKSTVPPGTTRTLLQSMPTGTHNIYLVYNPEFMREGSAIQDIYANNPLVLGGQSAYAMHIIETLYKDFLGDNIRTIKTDFETAELIKYAWNSFSALRISFINELAYMCRTFNARIETVTQGLACSEQLLPTHTIKPGPGYGGSCLPKDTQAYAHIMQQHGFTSSIVAQTIQSNIAHKKRIIGDICRTLEGVHPPHTVTLLGLSFKANTNDMRNAPSIDIIQALLDKNIIIKAYDPQAIPTTKKIFPSIHYFDSPYDAIKNSDCLVILTEWQEIKDLDLHKVASLCKRKMIIDTRNIYDTLLLKTHGFTYLNLGSL